MVECERGIPGIDGLANLLSPWHGANGYVVEFVGRWSIPLGNNGDELLGRVFKAVLPELGITPVRDPSQADMLMVRPGGALLDRYQAPRLLSKRLATLPDRPLVIFPSSSWFEKQDPAQMFADRTAPTLWVSREKHSHQHLQERWGSSLARANVALALDHDVVVSGHAHVREALDVPRPPDDTEGVLLVARLGVEGGKMNAPLARNPWCRDIAARTFKRLPPPVTITVRRRITRSRQDEANARMGARLVGDLPSDATLHNRSPWSLDISDRTLATYERYARAIWGASIVISDRLHVALPAVILGKRTYLVEAGYHKISGVYEQSLAQLENVSFVPQS